MNYVAASTLMTAFGEVPALPAWHWQVAAEIGHVPRLSESQQRVGFSGSKQEDLNRSPVFGRLRLIVGLPVGFVAELGYTPPLTVRGTRARDFLAAALGRRVLERDALSVSMRIFGQRGRVHGDITCPARLAGAPIDENPLGCQEPSNDRVVLNYHGLDATLAWRLPGWQLHATAGVARTELEVQVDALTFDVRDRSRLVARSSRPFAALGVSCDLDSRWRLGAEVLHVPLKVQRELDGASRDDPFSAVRIRLAYRFG